MGKFCVFALDGIQIQCRNAQENAAHTYFVGDRGIDGWIGGL
jgi:hypothetical protein